MVDFSGPTRCMKSNMFNPLKSVFFTAISIRSELDNLSFDLTCMGACVFFSNSIYFFNFSFFHCIFYLKKLTLFNS